MSVAIVALPLAWGVHRLVIAVCFLHADLYCRRSGFKPAGMRWRPEWDSRGWKTESVLVQVDCLDREGQPRQFTLLVWPFGVRRMLSEAEIERLQSHS